MDDVKEHTREVDPMATEFKCKDFDGAPVEAFAADAYRMADAMLSQRDADNADGLVIRG